MRKTFEADLRKQVAILAQSEVVSYLEDQVKQVIYAEVANYLSVEFEKMNWQIADLEHFTGPEMLKVNYHIKRAEARQMFKDIAKEETQAIIAYLNYRRDKYMESATHELATQVIAAREAAAAWKGSIDLPILVMCCGNGYGTWRGLLNHTTKTKGHQGIPTCCGVEYPVWAELKEHVSIYH